MKPVEIFLTELCSLDIKLWTEGNRLRCNAPQGKLTSELKTQLTQRKSEIIEYLDSHEVHPKVIDLEAEAVLDPTICLSRSPSPSLVSEPANVLLTGATGFLGSFLLYELLQQTQANIYCLVRGQNLEQCQQKIQSQLETYQLWNEDFKIRIISLIGDLSQPLLGFTPEEFQLIAEKIDVIYHNGALVHLFQPYTALKPANVLGTQEILRLACKSKIKPVHFISSLSVAQSLDYVRDGVVKEEPLKSDRSNHLYNGYAESKWVAERLVAIAHKRGLPVTIYRPGMVTGSSQTGVSKTQDIFSKLLKSFVQLGKVPDFDTVLWDLAPVDYVSKAVVYLSQRESPGKIFHLLNPQSLPISKIVDSMRKFGYALEQTTYDDWRTELKNLIESTPEHPLSSLLLTFAERFSKEQLQVLQLTYDCQNTLAVLKNSSISCLPPDAKLIHTYLAYFSDRGFLAPPKTDRAELTLNIGNK